MPPPAIDQHNAEIHENLRHWERKPLLRKQYAKFYNYITLALKDVPPGIILECGSGIGNLKSVIPDAVTSDLFPNSWLDRQENIYALSYPKESLAAVVLFDVFHHLEYPGWALKEIYRALKPTGKLIIFEPAMGLLGRIALGLFHHEPLALGKTIKWLPSSPIPLPSLGYYAAQGNAWRIFSKEDYSEQLKDWGRPHIQYYPALPWLLAGGFRGPTLCPAALEPVAGISDRLLTSLSPRRFSSRILIRLEKPGS